MFISSNVCSHMHASMIAVERSIPSSFSNQFSVWLSVFSAYGNINEQEWDEKVIEQRRQATGDDFEEDIKSAFSLIDKDADGVITTSDIYELMMGLGEMMTDEEIAEFIKTADLDNDGQINYRGESQSITGETLWTVNIGKPVTDICMSQCWNNFESLAKTPTIAWLRLCSIS